MRPTALITIILLVNACLFGLLALGAIGLETGLSGFAIGFLMAAVPVPFYIALALWIDRLEPEPVSMLAVAFFWGASIATFFAMIFNTLNEGILTTVTGKASASVLTNIFSAPLVEELAKGAALLLLFIWRRDEFDDVTDGIVYAAMVGLGFAMTENVLYYGRAAVAEGGGVAVTVFFLRGILGPFAHPLYTSMTGIGFGFARESTRTSRKWLMPLLGLGGAVALHSIWNLAATAGPLFFAAYRLIMVPAIVSVILVALFSLRRQAKMIRTHLEQVIATGVLSGDDIAIVTSVRGRCRESARALFRGGFAQWRERRRFHALATELAFHSWRAGRALEENAPATHAELLDQVRATRARLGPAI
jgi:RsiW-degrading membrane proteinase PrsW (M82 family)